jgi:hypothetical protein
MTWEDFRDALRTGLVPIDLNGFNAAGWTALGTALNKANLLSDTTAAKIAAAFGIDTPETPNEALSGMAVSSDYAKLLFSTVSTDASSISLDLSGVTMADYAELIISATIYTVLATTIRMTINSLTSGYYGARLGVNSTVTAISNAANFGELSTNANASSLIYPTPILLKIQAPYTGSSGQVSIEFSGGIDSAHKFGHCGRVVLENLSSVQFAAASGNIKTGSTFYVYGVKK